MHTFAKLPALGSQAPKQTVPQAEIIQEPKQESIEERKARLEARRDALLKKKAEEEKKKLAGQEEEKKEQKVHMKPQNESPADRKARLARCMQVLKQVDTGKASAFVGMGGVGKPIDINWNTGEEEPEEDESWMAEEAVVEVQKQGKKVDQSYF